MAAETAVVLAFARPGTIPHIALAEGAYFGTSVLFRSLEPWGIRFVEYDQTGPPPDADIVWVESPANPVLTVPDWGVTAEAHPGLVVCDATVATPIFLRALDEGADVVTHSATKYLTGSHDALLGATVTRDPERAERAPLDPLFEGRSDLRARERRLLCPPASTRSLAGMEQITARKAPPRSRVVSKVYPAVDRVRYTRATRA